MVLSPVRRPDFDASPHIDDVEVVPRSARVATDIKALVRDRGTIYLLGRDDPLRTCAATDEGRHRRRP